MLVNWNVAWRAPKGPSARIIKTRIAACEPDIICLTEADLAFPPSDGHVISAVADYGYPLVHGRRKVLLWSRNPWRQIDSLGDQRLPSGRFVRGVTDTPVGPVTVMGICVPWSRAHVSNGRRDRKPWEDHLTYLRHLAPLLRRLEGPAIVTGDFNQRIPRVRGSADAQRLLLDALGSLDVATRGTIPIDGEPTPRAAIDHVVHDRRLAATNVCGLSNHHDGRQLSDHFGVVVTLTEA